MASSSYLDFMRDSEPALRRAEFAAFVGPNATAYLRVYDRMYASVNRAPGERVKFSLFGTE